MTVARSADAPQTDLSRALLTSDFYSFQDLLTPVENEHVMQIREFLETEVRPIADDYWERAEFPVHLIPGSASSGCSARCGRRRVRFENSAVYRGWVALELSRVDAGFSTFIGVQNGLTMGAIGVGGSLEQRAELLPPMAAGSWWARSG